MSGLIWIKLVDVVVAQVAEERMIVVYVTYPTFTQWGLLSVKKQDIPRHFISKHHMITGLNHLMAKWNPPLMKMLDQWMSEIRIQASSDFRHSGFLGHTQNIQISDSVSKLNIQTFERLPLASKWLSDTWDDTKLSEIQTSSDFTNSLYLFFGPNYKLYKVKKFQFSKL